MPRDNHNDCKIGDFVQPRYFAHSHNPRAGSVVIAFINRSPCVFQYHLHSHWLRIL